MSFPIFSDTVFIVFSVSRSSSFVLSFCSITSQWVFITDTGVLSSWDASEIRRFSASNAFWIRFSISLNESARTANSSASVFASILSFRFLWVMVSIREENVFIGFRDCLVIHLLTILPSFKARYSSKLYSFAESLISLPPLFTVLEFVSITRLSIVIMGDGFPLLLLMTAFNLARSSEKSNGFAM